MTFTTLPVLITFNDAPAPSETPRLSLTLCPDGNRLHYLSRHSGQLGRPHKHLHQFARRPDPKNSESCPTSLSCPVPKPSSTPKSGRSITGPRWKRPFPATSLSPLLPLPESGTATALGGWTDSGGRGSPHQAPPGPLGSAPSTARLAQPSLRRTVGQHQPKTRHLLRKVGGGEGAPLV